MSKVREVLTKIRKWLADAWEGLADALSTVVTVVTVVLTVAVFTLIEFGGGILWGKSGVCTSAIKYTRSGKLTDSRDGKTYKTAAIGKFGSRKRWMAENLNYEAPGGSWCYGGDASHCDKYGRLYDWETARKVCPAGYHLPSRKEWRELAAAVEGRGRASGEIEYDSEDDSAPAAGDEAGSSGETGDDSASAAKGGGGSAPRCPSLNERYWFDDKYMLWDIYDYKWYNIKDDVKDIFYNGSFDMVGFSASGGRRDSAGVFSDVGKSGYWWTATEENSGCAYYLEMSDTDTYLDRDYYNMSGENGYKSRGFSVRCVADGK